ncbi:hypothetical protein AB6D66_00015 [Vibrio pomeroyi]|uniref:Uncharacterized protein n=1 Tax=Vibrio pomeroyi TaxID=198832 RepID=A0ABV4MQK8_9VIBR|nr:hypothetical protein [Vibrio atlanticus]MCZ4311333.1 hypothetical protein [Vibrio atlanticus]
MAELTAREFGKTLFLDSKVIIKAGDQPETVDRLMVGNGEFDCQSDTEIAVYLSRFFIFKNTDGKWEITLDRSIYEVDDLSEVEGLLYEYICYHYYCIP